MARAAGANSFSTSSSSASSASPPPPLVAITKTFFSLLYQHVVPRPIRTFLAWIVSAVLVPLATFLWTRITRSKLVQRIPPRLHRPILVMGLLTVALLLVGLPMALAQGPAFHCYPFPAEDPLSFSFGSLSPFCCDGPVDATLRIGQNCVGANAGNLRTKGGQELHSCGGGRTEACCMRVKYPPQIQKPPLSYCDEGFLVRPDAGNIVTEAPEEKHER